MDGEVSRSGDQDRNTLLYCCQNRSSQLGLFLHVEFPAFGTATAAIA
jgi:hypothetical protein